MTVIYWCEFPRECNWKKLASMLDKRKIVLYLTCTSREEYETWKKKIHEYSKNIEVNAWPTLPLKEGYWFSSFTNKEMIDGLEQFRKLKIKIDIEPPIHQGKYSIWKAMYWGLSSFLLLGPNKKYLQEKIKFLSKDTDIIVSTAPFPKYLLKRWGWIEDKKLRYNYIYYRTFIPKGLQWAYNIYYRKFIRKNKDAFFAVGLVGTGIFRNEPIYKNIDEMKKDISFLKKNGVQNIVFFRIESLVDRGWLDATF